MDAPLSGVKVLFIVAAKDFKDEELNIPKGLLEAAGATCIVASSDEGDAIGTSGNPVPAVPITEPRTTELSGVVVVGGPGAPKALWDNGLAHKVLRMLERDRRPIAAIENGVVVLAKAGLLNKRKATVPVSPETLRALKEGGAHYEKKPIVIDGDIVTVDGSESVERFGRLFRDLLQQKKETSRR